MSKIKRSKNKKIAVGVAVALTCLIFCILNGALIQGIVFAFAFTFFSLFELNFGTRFAKALNILWLASSSLTAVILTQLLLNVGIASVAPIKLILGAVTAGIFLGVVYVCTMNYRVTVIVGMVSMLLLATVNHFVFWFRGSEFAPYDIFAVSTAFNVAGKYAFEITIPMIYAYVTGTLYCFCGFMLPKCKVNRSVKSSTINLVAVAILFSIFTVGTTNINAQHFGQMGSFNNGYLLNFALQFRNLGIRKPDGYSVDTVRKLELVYQSSGTDEVPDVDVIAIMSEALGDMEVFGNALGVDAEIMPFVNSLQQNIVKGHALVSGIGGGTSKSEYEFITANSLGFLPTGCFPFQQYIEKGSYSIVTGFENYGFTSLGTHPATGENWMRATVYPNLGFDEYYFIEKYPQKSLFRDMVSDEEMFDQLIRWYQIKDMEENKFLFGVTMQNHSPYDFANVNFSNPVAINGLSRTYSDAEQYLSLLNESDRAFKKLISYFEQSDKKVVLIVFGDHMPQLGSTFYEELHGGSFETLEEQMLQYTVPFFIWANYDIEERDIGLTSVNFLSNYLFEAAGLPLPAYNAFLKDVQEVIPAMNAFGYYSNEKRTIIPYEEAEGKEAEMLNQYRILQYNCLFDKDNRSQVFFPAAATSE